MMNKSISSTSWSTASFGDDAQTSPMELSSLGAHLDMCKGSRGKMIALHCAAASMHGFLAARFVTTLLLVVLIIGAASLVL